jgi:hypothetical protein
VGAFLSLTASKSALSSVLVSVLVSAVLLSATEDSSVPPSQATTEIVITKTRSNANNLMLFFMVISS